MDWIKIGIDTHELQALQSAYARAPQIAQEEMLGFMFGLTQHLQGEVQALTPTAFGLLRASIIGNATPFANGLGVDGVVGSSLAYAAPVELGSKPHMPPVEPLIDWARQKLALDPKSAVSAGWAIARTIAQRGTLGVGMFHRAFAANKAQIAEQFRLTVSRIVARIGGRT